ncbi:MAG: hypothetical protein IK045_06795, partial [Bacteroidales bacterium]|nr:hypothetical protein [Bacteroidales bacterium]
TFSTQKINGQITDYPTVTHLEKKFFSVFSTLRNEILSAYGLGMTKSGVDTSFLEHATLGIEGGAH